MGAGTDSMPSGYYDITAQQNSTFLFHVEYYDNFANPINLSGSDVRLHVRPNYNSKALYLSATTSGITTGGISGEFLEGYGVSGTGGITLNKDTEGNSFTGGILVSVDATSMGYVRAGNWKYSIDIVTGNTVEEIVAGTFTVLPKVTR